MRESDWSSDVCSPIYPDYFLQRGELQRICKDLPGKILFHEEQPDDQMPTARVLFRKTD
jgi:hypothetical protein